MEEILVVYVLYSICACAVLVWSTLLDQGRLLDARMSERGIEYVAISEYSFFEPTEPIGSQFAQLTYPAY